MGVRCLVIASPVAGVATARVLPFGVWQLTPNAQVPRERRWFRWFGAGRAMLPAGTADSLGLVVVDLEKSASGDSRAWRDIKLAVDHAAEARNSGVIVPATVGQLARRLAAVNAARPQRSILRAAA
jgi:hypothetical protein